MSPEVEIHVFTNGAVVIVGGQEMSERALFQLREQLAGWSQGKVLVLGVRASVHIHDIPFGDCIDH